MAPVPPAAPASVTLFAVSLAAYAATLVAALVRPWLGRIALALAVAVHLAATVERGLLVGFVPLTNQLEAFSAAALALGIVTLAAWAPARRYVAPLVGLAALALGAALAFPHTVTPPPPILRTIWYPLHVPLAFLAYALFCAAGAAAAAWLRGRDEAWLRRVDRLALQGFAAWSLAMITGGIWGVLAWGGYFSWDPKVIWSVILWIYYASLVHVPLAPSLRGRVGLRPALALVGVALVGVAFVGTSFFFGRSSHAF